MRTVCFAFIAGALAIVAGCTRVEPAEHAIPPRTARPPATVDLTSIGLGTEKTLVVVLAPSCPPCNAALPFYARLMQRPSLDGVRRRLVVVGLGVVPIRRTLDAAGVHPHGLTSGPGGFAASFTDFPTVLLVDDHGVRQRSWIGPLSPEGESDVIAALER